MKKLLILMFCSTFILSCSKPQRSTLYPDMVILNGNIITVDKNFSTAEAIAIKEDKITAVGSNKMIERMAGISTKRINLEGKTVIPGINDAHTHPEIAIAIESKLFDKIPNTRTIKELLNWIEQEAKAKKPNEWIIYPKFFPTRMKELRQPTIKELDRAAPDNPVFLDGSFAAMINTRALQILGISKATNKKGILKDPMTGELTGYIQETAFIDGEPTGYVTRTVLGSILKSSEKELSYKEKLDELENMIKRYNEVGITSFCSAIDEEPGNIRMFIDLKKQSRLTARVYQHILVPFDFKIPEKEIRKNLIRLGLCTGLGDEWVKVGAIKTVNDAGICTGTAYLREPWGLKGKDIYGIINPNFRGYRYYTKEDLIPLIKVATELGWKYTAHCTGGGSVDILLDAFAEVNKISPVKGRRHSIIHGNFYTQEAVKKMSKLGIYADSQPAFFFMDGDAIQYVLGERRAKTFHPYKSLTDAGVIVNGGSDHMVKFDSYEAINPYNPFYAMWSVITRKTTWENVITPEEAVSREEALRMYTINNAYASFEEDIKGSIEPGKLADLAVISENILKCPIDNIKNIKVSMTMVGGKIVYKSDDLN
ncbi:amidohydrolase [candidate division KSB1 bacterium]